MQWRPVDSRTLAQMTFWILIPFVVTICRYLGSITLFARILKPVPTVFMVAGFHCNCIYSGSLWHKDPFAQMTLWVPISFAATFFCPLCSIALILKPVPMVYGVAGFHCSYRQGGGLLVTCSFILLFLCLTQYNISVYHL